MYSGDRIIHARGLKQMLRPVDAGEVVTGSDNYGYWHPDEVAPQDQRRAFGLGSAAAAARATAVAFGNLADAARGIGANAAEVIRAWDLVLPGPPAHLNARAAARPIAAALQNAADAARSLGVTGEDFASRRGFRTQEEIDEKQLWSVSYGGQIRSGYSVRQARNFVDAACSNSLQTAAALETLGRLIAAGGGQEHVRSAQGTDLGLMVVQRQELASTPMHSRVAPVDAPRFRSESRPLRDILLDAATWHLLVLIDAQQRSLYWQIRFAGRMMELWSGRDRAKLSFLECRRYAREEHVLPDAQALVLAEMRAGYLPHQIHDTGAFLLDVARSDAQVYARVMAAMAEALKPRSSVALGRFYSLDEDEEI